MSEDFIVRPARAEDREALGRLGAMLVAEHYKFDPLRFLEPMPGLAELYGDFLASRQSMADNFVLVADRGGAVVGYIFGAKEGADYMALRGPAGVLYDLLVDPDHRRCGIGAALMAAGLEALKKLGVPRALLFTAEKNHVAQAMFERTGFRRTMIEMTKEL